MWFKSRVTIIAVATISFCIICGTSPAHADVGDQLFKLLADDGAFLDRFGFSVAISGDCNANGIPDDCDIDSGFSLDCSGNGVPDDCDIADGTSPDSNGNFIPGDGDVIRRSNSGRQDRPVGVFRPARRQQSNGIGNQS